MTFEEAVARAAAGKSAGGIGTLGEKTVHATLKWWLDGDAAHHEVALPDGHVADIFDGERVTEIQTAGFSGFRPKLAALLESYPVTLVHPLVRRKRVVWIDPATGECTAPRRSPRTGSFADAGKELVYLLPLLDHPRLTVRLILLDVEERRLADGWGNGGKRGSHRAERLPLTLADMRTLSSPSDYAALVPAGLPSPFTAEQFGKAAHQQGRTRSATLKVLMHAGVLSRDRVGRGYEYKLSV